MVQILDIGEEICLFPPTTNSEKVDPILSAETDAFYLTATLPLISFFRVFQTQNGCCYSALVRRVVARRPFPPSGGMSHPGPVSSPPNTVESEKVCLPSPFGVAWVDVGLMDKEVMEEAHHGGVVSKIGSSPPSCEHKCYGCSPCEAIQVPSTSSRRSHLSVQYSNYEPESWKCKCGPSFYSP
ncbi:EPIDERMAL PATTERNING FACTOR-like protein 3, partial [Mucuna pruriens]